MPNQMINSSPAAAAARVPASTPTTLDQHSPALDQPVDGYMIHYPLPTAAVTLRKRYDRIMLTLCDDELLLVINSYQAMAAPDRVSDRYQAGSQAAIAEAARRGI